MEDIAKTDDTNETAETTANEVTDVEQTDASTGDSSAFVPDDELIERGIRAGMKLSDVQALASKDMAERIIGAMESRGARSTETAKNAEADGDGIPAISFDGFSEEDGYDPKLVKAMSSLRSTVEAQQKVIAKLMAGSVPKSKSAVAEVRRNLTLARPGGETGKRRETPASKEADILAELRQKYKLN